MSVNKPDSIWWALSKEDVKVRDRKIQSYSNLQQTRNWIQATTWMSLEADPKLQRRTLARMTFSLQFLWDSNLHQHRQHIKKQRHHFTNKGPYSQSCGFSSSHVQMWELDHKEGWVLKNWCFWTTVLEKYFFRVSWTARKSNQSILEEINPEYSLERLMLKLKL